LISVASHSQLPQFAIFAKPSLMTFLTHGVPATLPPPPPFELCSDSRIVLRTQPQRFWSLLLCSSFLFFDVFVLLLYLALIFIMGELVDRPCFAPSSASQGFFFPLRWHSFFLSPSLPSHDPSSPFHVLLSPCRLFSRVSVFFQEQLVSSRFVPFLLLHLSSGTGRGLFLRAVLLSEPFLARSYTLRLLPFLIVPPPSTYLASPPQPRCPRPPYDDRHR